MKQNMCTMGICGDALSGKASQAGGEGIRTVWESPFLSIVLPSWEWFLARSVPWAIPRHHPRDSKSQLHFI